MFQTESEEEELAQYKRMVEGVLAYRTVETPIDFIAMGITPCDKPDMAAEKVRQRSLLDATWWLELLAPFRFGMGLDGKWPLDALRERVLQGPPVFE